MNYFSMFLAATKTSSGGAGSMIGMIIFYVVIIGAMMYFMAIRPQKKQQQAMNELAASLAIGDSILTTSGFYGVVIDINEDIVVVEFGSNKNCRIPMRKEAIQTAEKPDGTTISIAK